MADDRPEEPHAVPADDAAVVRAAERRRRRKHARQSAVFGALFLLVLGIGIGAAGVNRGWWAGPFAVGEDAAPSPTSTPCPTTEVVPVDAGGVEVSVLNSTTRGGLAGGVAEELGARGLQVQAVANAPDDQPFGGTAQIRFGPEGQRSAQGLASIVPGAELARDDARGGPGVDLVLGEAFDTLEPADTPLTATVEPDPATFPEGCVPAAEPAPGPGTEPTPSPQP
ncbi:LytR C-terminal domain-containing protein [Pseudokineococcus sp. 1T1Z-3]|uniref:LytR C-terminal domain-containing protein n=1 Tax=Pseudokineococcus sp. 1T1Z-3 TaxID=3132745 RepID=UPI0030985DAF